MLSKTGINKEESEILINLIPSVLNKIEITSLMYKEACIKPIAPLTETIENLKEEKEI